MMKVAIIGYGVVGKATEQILFNNNRSMLCGIHDPEQDLKCNYKDADVVFICTPTNEVEKYLKELKNKPYVFVRSTIPFALVKNTDFAVWPEFLTERTWQHDALNPTTLVIGGNVDQKQMLVELTGWTEWHLTENNIAAFMKNATNTFYCMKISYANMLYDTCQEEGMSFNELKHCLKQDARMGDTHWDVPGPDRHTGYGGKCLPKNLTMMKDQISSDSKKVLEQIEIYNTLIRMGV
tara:strand:- start:117 stop:827 length:711 start_codon:yes stop_codon:yes gene_type:complete